MSIETQIVREAPEIEAYKLGILQQAQNLYGQPLNLPAVEAAGLPGASQQAMDLARQGIGAYQPYFEAGSQGITQGQALAQQGAGMAAGVDASPAFAQAQSATQQGINAAGGIGQAFEQAGQFMQADLGGAQNLLGGAAGMATGALGSYDTGMTQQFMNPYQEQVTQKALQEMRRQNDLAAQQSAAQAVRSGAFGATREGVQRAEQERNIQDLMSQRIFQDYAANYGQAQNAGMTAFEQARQRQLAAANTTGNIGNILGTQNLQNVQLGQAGAANRGALAASQAGTLGSLGQGIGALGAQQANIDLNRASLLGNIGTNIGSMGVQQAALGEGMQRLNAADVGLLSGLGSIEQQNAQAQLDAQRATALQEAMAPYQQLAFTSDIYKGAPSSQMTLTSSSVPTASPFQSALGTVIGGVTTAAAANRAGLF